MRKIIEKGKLPSLVELNKMGISLYDTKGKPKSVKDLLKELAKKTN